MEARRKITQDHKLSECQSKPASTLVKHALSFKKEGRRIGRSLGARSRRKRFAGTCAVGLVRRISLDVVSHTCEM